VTSSAYTSRKSEDARERSGGHAEGGGAGITRRTLKESQLSLGDNLFIFYSKPIL